MPSTSLLGKTVHSNGTRATVMVMAAAEDAYGLQVVAWNWNWMSATLRFLASRTMRQGRASCAISDRQWSLIRWKTEGFRRAPMGSRWNGLLDGFAPSAILLLPQTITGVLLDSNNVDASSSVTSDQLRAFRFVRESVGIGLMLTAMVSNPGASYSATMFRALRNAVNRTALSNVR
jgi:hypothetical protein